MTEHDKTGLKLLAEGVAGTTLTTLAHTAVTYYVGKKVAPSIFTSFGRTYGILYLIHLLKLKLDLPQDYRDRVAAYSKRDKAGK